MSFLLYRVNCGGVDIFGDGLSHGGSVEVDPMCVVDDAVEDGVGECGLADDVVPLGNGQLAGDQDGGVVVSILDDFHEVAPLIGVETVRSPVIENEEVSLGEGAEQSGVSSVGALPKFEHAQSKKAARYSPRHRLHGELWTDQRVYQGRIDQKLRLLSLPLDGKT